jgi:hypothetical protein
MLADSLAPQALLIAAAEGIAGITAGATVFAALIVALITARTTNGRQERQLTAEAERQTAALAHERELADIADLRQLLDEAATVLDPTLEALRSAYAYVLYTGKYGERRPDEAASIFGDAQDALANVLTPILNFSARFHVRLGPSDPITVAFQGAVELVRDVAVAVARLQFGVAPAEGDAQLVQGAEEAFAEIVPAFHAAAVDRAGTKLV